MTNRNKILAGLLAVTALGGVAVAADMTGQKGPMRADTNGDGIVSRAEFFTAAESRFKERDTNGDRKLSGDEMKDKRGRFARQDTNNDGVLSFEEAAAHTSAQFTRQDVDKDGKLTPEEMGPRGRHGKHDRRDGPNGPGGPGGPRGGMGMERLDTNKDGTIDQAELQARGPGRPGGPGGDTPPPPPAPEAD